MEYKPCLIIVFNHRFDRNIDVLEKLYANRFTHIFFLVPFYTGTNPRVIPVYESSLYFQGYFAQGYKTFYRPDFSHYIFIGDDLILNPAVNEHTYAQLLNLDADTSYVPDLCPLHERAQSLYAYKKDSFSTDNYWWHSFKGIRFYDNRRGSQTKAELPTRAEAMQRFAAFGIAIRPLSYYNVFGSVTFPTSVRAAAETVVNLISYYVLWHRFKVPGHLQQLELQYPLAYSYSDVVVVAAPAIQRFCHISGLFSAMGLFVEMAIPTALILAGDKIVTDKNVTLKGKALWQADEISALETKYKLDLAALLADFPPEQLYYHPIKLSRWRLPA